MIENVMKYLVDSIYVLIAVLMVTVFAKRGFFESVFHFGRHIAAGLISYFVGPTVSGFISSGWIYNGIFNVVSEKMEAFLVNTAGSFDLAALIDSLPFLVKQFIDPAVLEERYGATVGNFGVVADDFAASVATPLSNIISNLIAYAAVYLVAMLALWVVFKVLNGIFKLPVLNFINGALGAVLGVLAAILTLAVITWVLTFVLGLVGFDSPFSQYVSASRLFAFFGEWEIFGFLN